LTTKVVDARGQKCPLPVLKAEKALAGIRTGGSLTVLATDAMAKVDIPLFCRQNGHECTVTSEGDVLKFEIVKAG
jgi:tRNA 2-thiouridine synthesizing protein A